MRFILFFLLSIGIPLNPAWAQSDSAAEYQSLKQSYLQLLLDYSNHQEDDWFAIKLSQSVTIDETAPSLSQIILFALERDNLQNDSDIRKALSIIEQSHPDTMARYHASKVLNPTKFTANPIFSIGSNPLKSISSIPTSFELDINRTRKYCTAESIDAKSLPSLSNDLKEKLSPFWEDTHITKDGEIKNVGETIKGVKTSAQHISDGWLTGYSGRTGLGLHYIPEDESIPTQYLMQGTIHAIIPHKDRTSFFVLSTKENKIAGFRRELWRYLDISLVKQIEPEKFEITPYSTLPTRFRSLAKMENGDLFLDFGDEKKFNFYQGSGVQTTYPAFSSNPPIGFTNTGQIYEACKTNTRKF